MSDPHAFNQFGQPQQTAMPNSYQSPSNGPGRPQERQPQHMTVCGIISVVFGALGFVLSFIPIINNLAAILGFIGLILAVIALVGTFRGKKKGKALSIVSTVLCVLSIVITLAMQSATNKAINDAMGGVSASQQPSGGQSNSAGTAQGSAGPSSSQSVQDMEGDVDSGNYHVKMVSMVKSGADYEGKATAILTYEVTNNKSENSNFMDMTVKAFQNGQQLETAIFMDAPDGYDAGSTMKELQPGATGTITMGYVLTDDSPVSVEIEGTLDASGTKVTHEFALQ